VKVTCDSGMRLAPAAIFSRCHAREGGHPVTTNS
jgi:hypothetical protein